MAAAAHFTSSQQLTVRTVHMCMCSWYHCPLCCTRKQELAKSNRQLCRATNWSEKVAKLCCVSDTGLIL